MKRRIIYKNLGYLIIVITFIGMLYACKQATKGYIEPKDAYLVRNNEDENKMKPMKKVQVLVGGCLSDCEDPEMAIHRFLEATLECNPERVAMFLDSTKLVVDGEKLGQKWVEMWKSLRTATRKESIMDTALYLCHWKDGLNKDEVKDAMTSGIKPVKIWSSEAIFIFRTPRLNWEVVLRPRGLEWLIVKITKKEN